MSRGPRRGDVYWVTLDPVVGTEIRKTRPAVIVSNDSCNRYGTRVVVLPITSNVASLYPVVCENSAEVRIGDSWRSRRNAEGLRLQNLGRC
jgi:mRNA-degrading endonuclease toxin of MazEF toxin-antitoxin module